MHYSVATKTEFEYQDDVYGFNQLLERMASVSRLDETVLGELMDLLEKTCLYESRLFWLSLARVNELAIVCAGNYAENCEYGLVGDLLVNPREVLVHVRGRSQPILKQRHTPLTEQFSHVAGTRCGVISWLKTRAIVEKSVPAILPHLFSRLKESGLFHKFYLSSIESRQQRLADLSAYLASQGFESRLALDRWCENAAPGDRNVVASRMCGFDFQLFDLLGEDLEKMCLDDGHGSAFLVSS